MCQHLDGFVDLTLRQITLLAQDDPRPDLYVLVDGGGHHSPFIVRRCDCADAPPIDADRYVPYPWNEALRIAERAERSKT